MGCAYCGGLIKRQAEMCYLERHDPDSEDVTKTKFIHLWAFHKECLDKQEERFDVLDGAEDQRTFPVHIKIP